MAITRKRSCFVIMPFGTKGGPATASVAAEGGEEPTSAEQANGRTASGRDASELWRLEIPRGEREARFEIDFDRLYSEVISKATTDIKGYDIETTRCDEIRYTGWVHERMIESIAHADIAVVELTTLNPNVFYELGVRHALNRGITVLLQHDALGERIPFNLAGMSVVKYDMNEPAAAVDIMRGAISDSLERQANIDSLVFKTLPALRVEVTRPAPVERTTYTNYSVGDSGARLGIVTGDIKHVRGVDIWVSSENTEMMMARYNERAVSASIRYLGAKKSHVGTIDEDVIVNALTTAMKDVTSVPPASIVVTESGHLALTNDVRWIFHAAAVTGQIGCGYAPIPRVRDCVVGALARIDAPEFIEQDAVGAHGPSGSILMPLFAAGQAGQRAEDTAMGYFRAVVEYFRRTPDTRAHSVFFLAFTDEEVAVCERVLESLDSDGELSDKMTGPTLDQLEPAE